MKGGKNLDQLSGYQLSKKIHVPCRLLGFDSDNLRSIVVYLFLRSCALKHVTRLEHTFHKILLLKMHGI
jgi:hypothetical protein